MSDNQEAKCFEFAVQILPPPPRNSWGVPKKFPPPELFLFTPLPHWVITATQRDLCKKILCKC